MDTAADFVNELTLYAVHVIFGILFYDIGHDRFINEYAIRLYSCT